jgi:hypothetical protein
MADHEHDFQPSGWCSRCPYRIDGRYSPLGDVVSRGRDDSPDFDAHAYRIWLEGQTHD